MTCCLVTYKAGAFRAIAVIAACSPSRSGSRQGRLRIRLLGCLALWGKMQPTAADVLQAFRRDEIRLFIAASAVAVGFVTIGFSFIRRRFDRQLSFFVWFVILYGVRLWMQSGIHDLMTQASLFLIRFQLALNFFMAIPAFLFFEASTLIDRAGRVTVYIVCLAEMCLIGAVFLGLPLPLLDKINCLVVIGGSIAEVILAFRQPTMKDALTFRIGLITFVAFVLWTNTAALVGRQTSVELYGFTVFLCCLGYTAAKRTLDRDRQLNSINQELEIARRIQLSILPQEFPALEPFAVTARHVPMTSVAGDFYDFINTDNGGLGLLIADVSGHGVPAALIASMIKVTIQSQRHCAEEPECLLAGVNEVLCGNTQSQFVTAAYIYLCLDRGKFSYGAAGHPPMLLLRAGQVSRIAENGLVWALLPSAVYTSTTQPLLRGDRFLLYTDGIIEAINAAGEEFGYERLSTLLQVTGAKRAEETADFILNAVNGWSATQSDDLTFIVCDYDRKPNE